MTEDEEDMALEALLATLRELAPHLPAEILKQAYAIEKAFRFDDSRDVPLRNLQKLIEDVVAAGQAE